MYINFVSKSRVCSNSRNRSKPCYDNKVIPNNEAAVRPDCCGNANLIQINEPIFKKICLVLVSTDPRHVELGRDGACTLLYRGIELFLSVMHYLCSKLPKQY